MYNNFFGFREKPFKLVPNPAYLFLSKSHEEALAHLNYAISQGDGFVEITGEVGTGKTTLCRAFLDNLDENTVAAYIFNPKLGPKQLIKNINDEFGIKYDTENTKDLIDKLNAFLMQQKTEGKKVIVLIDEAQNLSNNVLEQLRLLSNLETSKDKLIQIILVGQPELAQMLDSYELRQIGQRINLRYLLSPLTFNETEEYIQYRINIASRKKALKFDRSAFRRIYKYSRGIPRLINIACDRTLLTAYGLNQHKITGKITKASIKELTTRAVAKHDGMTTGKKALWAFAGLSLGLFMVIFYQPVMDGVRSYLKLPQIRRAATPISPPIKTESPVPALSKPAQPPQEPVSSQPEPVQPEPETTTAMTQPETATVVTEPETTSAMAEPPLEFDLADYLAKMDIKYSRIEALTQAMDLWKTPIEIKPYLDRLDDDDNFFRIAAKANGLYMHRIETDMNILKRLNLPAILEFYPPGSRAPGYLTLRKIDGDRITLGGTDPKDRIETDVNEINFYWSGVAYVLWKNFLGIWGTIPVNSYKDSVITLKLLLQDLGFDEVEISDDYDRVTQSAVERIQNKYGIPVDGFVGPLTKIILYREKNAFEMPKLSKN